MSGTGHPGMVSIARLVGQTDTTITLAVDKDTVKYSVDNGPNLVIALITAPGGYSGGVAPDPEAPAGPVVPGD